MASDLNQLISNCVIRIILFLGFKITSTIRYFYGWGGEAFCQKSTKIR